MEHKRGSIASLQLLSRDDSRVSTPGMRKVRSAANLQQLSHVTAAAALREQANRGALTDSTSSLIGAGGGGSALSGGRVTPGLFRLQRCQSLVGMMQGQHGAARGGGAGKLPSTSKCCSSIGATAMP